MAVTMTLHNLPEGFAVAFAAFTDFGPIMAAAIAFHNIPEVGWLQLGCCRAEQHLCLLQMCPHVFGSRHRGLALTSPAGCRPSRPPARLPARRE
jgi:hypothetical protein